MDLNSYRAVLKKFFDINIIKNSELTGGIVMELLVTILDESENIEDIMLEFTKLGIKGSTIIDSLGMANVLSECEDFSLFSSLKLLMNDGRAEKKTILTVLKSDMVDSAISAIKKFVDIDAPGSGIIFTLPVGRVVGIPS